MICKYFVPFSQLPFPFIDYFFAVETSFSLMWFDLPFFFFLIACAFGESQLIPSQTNVKERLPWMECSVYMY